MTVGELAGYLQEHKIKNPERVVYIWLHEEERWRELKIDEIIVLPEIDKAEKQEELFDSDR
nr:hypothetical protein 15 [bacterium]